MNEENFQDVFIGRYEVIYLFIFKFGYFPKKYEFVQNSVQVFWFECVRFFSTIIFQYSQKITQCN